MSVPFETVLQAVIASSRIYVFSLDISTVSYLSSELDIHDAILVATARFCKDFFDEDVSILTNDMAITQSGLVPVVW